MREECRAQARTRTGAPPTDMGSRQADRKRRSRASVQVVPPRARRGLVADNSPSRAPGFPGNEREIGAQNLRNLAAPGGGDQLGLFQYFDEAVHVARVGVLCLVLSHDVFSD